MPSFTKCPCCNDNEHDVVPQHDIMITQTLNESGVINYLATYYYCPITQELYEDEELQRANMQTVESIIKESMDGRKDDKS